MKYERDQLSRILANMGFAPGMTYYMMLANMATDFLVTAAAAQEVTIISAHTLNTAVPPCTIVLQVTEATQVPWGEIESPSGVRLLGELRALVPDITAAPRRLPRPVPIIGFAETYRTNPDSLHSLRLQPVPPIQHDAEAGTIRQRGMPDLMVVLPE